MQEKMGEICRRFDELSARMGSPEIYQIPGEYQKVAKEAAQLEPLALSWRRLQAIEEGIEDAKLMLDDEELAELARAELKALQVEQLELRDSLRLLLLPKDPNDEKDILLEIRAGTGGEEASLFAADLFRMYSRYADKQGWKVGIISKSLSDTGGFKEVIASISGDRVFSTLKFEVGVHRVQRVPSTESQGRIHTSACTVAVLPEAEELELEIPEIDIRVDRYRASGPGGQSVNTTDSAIRLTHKPSGLVVSCQDEKSQHKNKAKALTVLRARLFEMKQAEMHAERADARRSMVGSGDRSERIRTYNFPQNRVTDHRVGLTLYKLEEIIDGGLDPVINPVRAAQQAELLKSQG